MTWIWRVIHRCYLHWLLPAMLSFWHLVMIWNSKFCQIHCVNVISTFNGSITFTLIRLMACKRLFSSPEPKAQVSYCHSAPSVVRPSVRRRPSVNFHIFDFSSETAERISTKLKRKQDLNALYQVCVFWADRKNKMAAPASDWLRHFRLLLWNRSMEFKETWQEARSESPLPSLCFSGR